MQVELIERDMRKKEEALKNCKYSLSYLKQLNQKTNASLIYILSQEAFFIADQLSHYNTVLNLLRDENEISMPEVE